MANLKETGSAFIYDDHDHSALPMIATIASSVLMIFTLLAKGLVQRATKASCQAHDCMLYGGGFLMLAQTICIAAAIKLGIGRHSAALLADDLETIQKVRLPRQSGITREDLTKYLTPCPTH